MEVSKSVGWLILLIVLVFAVAIVAYRYVESVRDPAVQVYESCMDRLIQMPREKRMEHVTQCQLAAKQFQGAGHDG